MSWPMQPRAPRGPAIRSHHVGWAESVAARAAELRSESESISDSLFNGSSDDDIVDNMHHAKGAGKGIGAVPSDESSDGGDKNKDKGAGKGIWAVPSDESSNGEGKNKGKGAGRDTDDDMGQCGKGQDSGKGAGKNKNKGFMGKSDAQWESYERGVLEGKGKDGGKGTDKNKNKGFMGKSDAQWGSYDRGVLAGKGKDKDEDMGKYAPRPKVKAMEKKMPRRPRVDADDADDEYDDDDDEQLAKRRR
jgi:hypothetical protein